MKIFIMLSQENNEYVPIGENKIYTVSGTDYLLLNSGDGNSILKDCQRMDKYMCYIDLLIEFIKANNGIPIKYENVDERIIIE